MEWYAFVLPEALVLHLFYASPFALLRGHKQGGEPAGHIASSSYHSIRERCMEDVDARRATRCVVTASIQ